MTHTDTGCLLDQLLMCSTLSHCLLKGMRAMALLLFLALMMSTGPQLGEQHCIKHHWVEP